MCSKFSGFSSPKGERVDGEGTKKYSNYGGVKLLPKIPRKKRGDRMELGVHKCKITM